MTGPTRDRSLPPRLLALCVGLAGVAFTGAATLDSNRIRFFSKPQAERSRLRENLRRFDMNLRPEEQRAVRDLDARLSSMPPEERDEYLIVLRRYHNWLHQLPERQREAILSDPPERRPSRIQELAVKHPPPDWRTSSSLDFIQTGGTGAFELAALCKTWLALSPADRKAVDGLEVGRRREELARRGRELKIPREIRPADYDEAHWMGEAEARIREFRETTAGPRDWLSKIEAKFEANNGVGALESAPRLRLFVRRLADNLYVEEHPIEHPVDPGRLEQFYIAIPSWIQSTFSAFSGDEARRRLTVVYRLLYPHPEEYRPGGATSAPAASKAVPKAAPTPVPVPVPPPTVKGTTPF